MQNQCINSLSMVLIEHGFIGVKDSHGQIWTLKHMVSMGHDAIIEEIRCHKLWSLEKTEEYIQFYIAFVNWLSEATCGYVPLADDPDVRKTAQRKFVGKSGELSCFRRR